MYRRKKPWLREKIVTQIEKDKPSWAVREQTEELFKEHDIAF